MAVLHTWGQNLMHHPHLHCVVPAGGIAPDGSRWIACHKTFFLPVRVLSRVFRGKFIALLKRAHEQGQLVFSGSLWRLADQAQFEAFLTQAVRQDWVVYAKPPFGGPRQVLKYLARYTHRVAIANSRIAAFDGRSVAFRWKDYANSGQQKTMILEASEFVRRFLMHVLPRGFTRIRYFGFLANRHRGPKLATIRQLLGMRLPDAPIKPGPEAETSGDDETARIGCPVCRSGQVHKVAKLPPTAPAALSWLLPRRSKPWWDTS